MLKWNGWVEMPAQWQDERIRSSAALLSLDAGVPIKPESVEETERRLQEIADHHGLDPDQLHRAMTEHEGIIGFQEEDRALARVAFTHIF